MTDRAKANLKNAGRNAGRNLQKNWSIYVFILVTYGGYKVLGNRVDNVEREQQRRAPIVESVAVIASQTTRIEEQSRDNGKKLEEMGRQMARVEADISWLRKQYAIDGGVDGAENAVGLKP